MGAGSRKKQAARRAGHGAPSPSDSGNVVRQHLPDGAIFFALWLLSFLLYLPTLQNGFVGYDDDQYVTANKVVQQGLTAQGVVWAFTTSHFGNWLPVTWLSHMLDVSMFGLNPGGHHATSAVLHGLNAALVFLLLLNLLRSRWLSAAAALLFAVHPLRVESVAWIAERKDVLAGTFFLLTMLAYVAYCRSGRWKWYAVTLVMYGLGLMSKTMLTTVPCLMLLLDWWPLRRTHLGPRLTPPSEQSSGPNVAPPAPIGKLLLEKAPLAAMAIIASAWTVHLQSAGGMMSSASALPLTVRLGNAVVAIPRYLGKIFWPSDLSILYPYLLAGWPAWKVAAAGALIVAISTVAILYVRRAPYVLVGWLWFLGMLVPVSGIVQVGRQSMADRYTYLPGIGLLVALVWAAAALLAKRRRALAAAAGAVLLICAVLAVLTVKQERIWADTYSLFSSALAADEENALAHSHVGSELAARGDREGARAHFQRAIQIDPLLAAPRYNLGNSFAKEAMERRAANDSVGFAEASNAAIAEYQQTIRLDPSHARAYFNLGIFALIRNDLQAAEQTFIQTISLDPEMTDARLRLIEVLLAEGRPADAAAQVREALARDPKNPRVLALAARLGLTG